MLLKEGDRLAVRDNDKSGGLARQFIETAESRGFPAWLAVHKEKLEAQVLHVPSRDEIAPAVDERLIVELYSK